MIFVHDTYTKKAMCITSMETADLKVGCLRNPLKMTCNKSFQFAFWSFSLKRNGSNMPIQKNPEMMLTHILGMMGI